MPVDHAAVIADLEEKRSRLDEVIVLLRDLYGSPATAPFKTCAPQKNHKRLKAAVPKEDEDGRRSPIQEALLVALKAGPMTSIQAFEALKGANVATTAGSVYQTLRVLLSKGFISKTENDEGRNAWKLAK
jgi:hypothetical protein